MKQKLTKYRILGLLAVMLTLSVMPHSIQAARVTASSTNAAASSSGFFSYLVPTIESLSSVLSTHYLFFPAEEAKGFAEEQLPDTTVAIVDRTAPSRLFLDQNYPNPFRDVTSIRYGIPQNGQVKVTIHTMLGSPIKTLVDEQQKAGIYTIKLTEPDLMPGLYFYRIQTSYGSLTRRMTISQ